MRIAGIIAEYNPLHNGHAYHIRATREMTSCDAVIVAMSGSFVQRGEPAAYSKFVRARRAVEAGADVVLELPTIYSLQSAARFAFGGVNTLSCAGADVLSFGSECADVSLVSAAAELISDETGDFSDCFRKSIDAGMPYAGALTAAAEQMGERSLAELLKKPNFLLAAEYAARAMKYAPDMLLNAVPRKGAQHDQTRCTGEFMSASAIREAILKGKEESIAAAVPQNVLEDIYSLTPATFAGLEKIILYKLRITDAKTLADICGVNEGMENLMLHGAKTNSLNGLLECVKSKRYTMARIKRALCCALLDIDRELAAAEPQYLRVLALKRSAFPLLKRFKLPIICKKADYDSLPENAKAIAKKDMLAADLREIVCGGKAGLYADFTQKLIIV